MAYPTKPTAVYDHTSHSTATPNTPHPGDKMDQEHDALRTAINAIIDFLKIPLASDGTLKPGLVASSDLTQDAIDAVLAVVRSDVKPEMATLAYHWAEYLPGPIPPSTLAETAISGAHWSARYWANQANIIVNGGAPQETPFYVDNRGDTMTGPLILDADPTAALGAATKQYVDAQVGTPAAVSVTYSNATSGLTASDVQAALDEIEGRVDTLEAAPATAASGITYSNTTSGLAATDVQAAIDEVEGRLDTAEANVTTAQSTASAAQTTADAALPKAGGTMTGIPTVQTTAPAYKLDETDQPAGDDQAQFILSDGIARVQGTSNGKLILEGLAGADLTQFQARLAGVLQNILTGADKASQAQADAGTDDNTYMTPLKSALAERFGNQLLHVREEQVSGTDGGTHTSGSYVTRVLNTVLTNEITGASLASNQILLPTGEYFILARAPHYNTAGGTHKAKLVNATDTADLLVGASVELGAATDTTSYAWVTGRFSLAASKACEITHRTTVTKNTTGLGGAAGFGEVEVYTDVLIWKVG